MAGNDKNKFQSHLRLIHPIHSSSQLYAAGGTKGFNRICASSTLSTWMSCIVCSGFVKVSIASAPHPPYPLAAI